MRQSPTTMVATTQVCHMYTSTRSACGITPSRKRNCWRFSCAHMCGSVPGRLTRRLRMRCCRAFALVLPCPEQRKWAVDYGTFWAYNRKFILVTVKKSERQQLRKRACVVAVCVPRSETGTQQQEESMRDAHNSKSLQRWKHRLVAGDAVPFEGILVNMQQFA